MPNWRMFPPSSPSGTIVVGIGNRTYRCAQGNFLDVADFDAAVLRSNGWTSMGRVGSTAERNASVYVGIPGQGGLSYVDTTLGYTVWWDGANWRDTSATSR